MNGDEGLDVVLDGIAALPVRRAQSITLEHLGYSSEAQNRQIEAARQWTEAGLTQHLQKMLSGILRMKGGVPMVDGNIAAVQCVGSAIDISVQHDVSASCALVLIGLRDSEGGWSDWISRFGVSAFLQKRAAHDRLLNGRQVRMAANS